jgi:hypothetical protein
MLISEVVKQVCKHPPTRKGFLPPICSFSPHPIQPSVRKRVCGSKTTNPAAAPQTCQSPTTMCTQIRNIVWIRTDRFFRFLIWKRNIVKFSVTITSLSNGQMKTSNVKDAHWVVQSQRLHSVQRIEKSKARQFDWGWIVGQS